MTHFLLRSGWVWVYTYDMYIYYTKIIMYTRHDGKNILLIPKSLYKSTRSSCNKAYHRVTHIPEKKNLNNENNIRERECHIST